MNIQNTVKENERHEVQPHLSTVEIEAFMLEWECMRHNVPGNNFCIQQDPTVQFHVFTLSHSLFMIVLSDVFISNFKIDIEGKR